MLRFSRVFYCIAVGHTVSAAAANGFVQRSVKAKDAWVQLANGGAVLGGATIENGTMYDVYLVSVQSDAAETAELVQMAGGESRTAKELPIAAFDTLQMTPTTTHVSLRNLKRPLKSGDSVSLTFTFDNGDSLGVTAAVK